MAFSTFNVVGGVVIPNYLNKFAAMSGINACLFYRYSRDVNKTYGVKLSDRLTSFMTGSVMLTAGFTAYDLSATNKDLARIRDRDKTEFEKMMTARKFPNHYKKSVAGPRIAAAGAIGMMILTLIDLSSFHKKTVMEYDSFQKKTVVEYDSANSYSV